MVRTGSHSHDKPLPDFKQLKPGGWQPSRIGITAACGCLYGCMRGTRRES